jgi:hypothetical protein
MPKRLFSILTALAMLLPITAPHALAADTINTAIPAPLLLAQANVAEDAKATEPPTAIDQAVGRGGEANAPKRRWITPNKLHQYLGLAALGLGLATGLSAGLAEEDEDEGPGAGTGGDGGAHETIAYAATAVASAAAISGFLYHREDVGFDKPLTDPDNLHMALTAAGVAGFIGATALGGEDGHSVLGFLGGLSMLVGVKITW